MKNWIAKSALVAGIFVGALSAHAAVWKDTNTWSDAWEQKFSAWVQSDYNEDIYTHGKWAGTSTDCADAVYLSRLIFSYENKLPYVIGDSTNGQGKITNQMSRFDNVANEKDRVKQFMKFIEWNTSTKTFVRDTIPVKISREYVRPGAVWVRPGLERNWNGFLNVVFGHSGNIDPGHSEVIKDVTPSGVVMLMGSTVPSAVRTLTLTSSFMIMPDKQDTGIRNWIWPQDFGKARAALPGYSLEQFNMGVGFLGSRSYYKWRDEVQAKLGTRTETRQEQIDRYAKDLCSLVRSRTEIVNEGLNYRAKKGGACMTATEYDSFSTPSRDKRIKQEVEDLASAVGGNGFGVSGKIESEAVRNALNNCPVVNIAPSNSITVYEYIVNVSHGRYSSNPNDSLNVRWGFSTDKSSNCPEY